MNQIIECEPDVVCDETFLDLGHDVRTITADVPCVLDGLDANCYLPERYERTAHHAEMVYGYVDGEERVHGEVTGVTVGTYHGEQRLRVHTAPYGGMSPVTEEAILRHE